MSDPIPRFHVQGVSDGTFWIRDRIHPEMDINHPELLASKSRDSANAVCDILNKWYSMPKEVRKVYS